MQKGVKELLKSIAEKYKLDMDVIEQIYMSQFLGAKECLSKNDLTDASTFQNVRFKYLGTLRYHPAYTKVLCQKRKQRLLDTLEKESSNMKQDSLEKEI